MNRDVEGPGAEEDEHRVGELPGTVDRFEAHLLARLHVERHRLPHERVADTKRVRAGRDVTADGIAKQQVSEPLAVERDDQLALPEIALVRARDRDGRRVQPPAALPILDIVCIRPRSDGGVDHPLHDDSLHLDLGEKRVVIGGQLSFGRTNDGAREHLACVRRGNE